MISGEIVRKLDLLAKRVDDLEVAFRQKRPSPVLEAAVDMATIEAIYDILASPYTNSETGIVRPAIVSQDEIRKYIDQYGQHFSAILHILIDYGITTPKEYNCKILAYHHLIRLMGLQTGIGIEALAKERIEYEKYLMSLNDPLSVIGR